MKHGFLKHALWSALFVAGGALAQNAAISGADFTSGKADAQLAAVGGNAAAHGEAVVVTAPTYWQAKVAAKIRAGAHGKPVAIRFSNGFYENVLVRTEAAAPAEAAVKPAPRPVAKPEAKVEPKVAAKTEPKAEAGIAKVEPKPEIKAESKPLPAPKPTVAAAPAPKPAELPHVAAPAPMQASVQHAPVSVPAQQPAPKAAEIVALPQVSQQPAVVPIPTTPISQGGVKSEASEASLQDNAAVRQRMLASLNDGRPAMGSLTEAQLQSGDQVYADGETLAAVRLEGLSRSFYWLQQPVDLQRVQFRPQGNGHYEVTGPIDPNAPVAHRAAANLRRVVSSSVPAAGSAARARLEQQYNSGQPITGSLSVARLQPEDRLLVDGGAIVVARREGNSMARYWLDGSIDLGQSGVQKVDANVYRVVGNNLH